MINTNNLTRAYAPGRVEILGNHTDYNGGYVLAGAINQGVTVEGKLIPDRVIRLSTVELGREITIDASCPLVPRGDEDAWANYALGVLKLFQDHGARLESGVQAKVSSNLPIGAGLSSSAALMVSFGTLLESLLNHPFEPMKLANLCRRCENEFVGLKSGLLDMATSIFGKSGHLVSLDCRAERVNSVAFPTDIALLVIHSGAPHQLSGSEYNDRVASCNKAAVALGVSQLRDVDLETLHRHRKKMDSLSYRRALQRGRRKPPCARGNPIVE